MPQPIWFTDPPADETETRLLLSRVGTALSHSLPQRSPDDGIHRSELLAHLAEPLRRLGFLPGGAPADLHRPQLQTALAVYGGRAYSNNEVVWHLLKLAGRKDTRSALFVVPRTYKRSQCSDKVIDQLDIVAASHGITIEMDWVAVVPF